MSLALYFSALALYFSALAKVVINGVLGDPFLERIRAVASADTRTVGHAEQQGLRTMLSCRTSQASSCHKWRESLRHRFQLELVINKYLLYILRFWFLIILSYIFSCIKCYSLAVVFVSINSSFNNVHTHFRFLNYRPFHKLPKTYNCRPNMISIFLRKPKLH